MAQLPRVFTGIVLLFMAGVLLTQAAQSLQWRLVVDTPQLAYMAYLIEQLRYVPYRDFFDLNIPGIFAVYALVGKVSGYSDFGFRIADLAYVSALLIVTASWMVRFGRLVAISAVTLFGLLYMSCGAYMTLQRDALELLPISCAVLVLTTHRPMDQRLRAILIGLFFGCAATLKPHALVGLPVLMGYQLIAVWRDHRGGPSRPRALMAVAGAAALGCLVPLSATALILWYLGALDQFLDMASNYWPIYQSISGRFEALGGFSDQLFSALKGFMTSGSARFLVILVPGVLGLYIALYQSTLDESAKSLARIVAALGVAYAGYALFAGKFFLYHMILFGYFAVLLAAMCLVEQRNSPGPSQSLFPVLVLFVVMAVACRPAPEFTSWLAGRSYSSPRVERADEIAAYLKANLKPADTVQALDVIEGGTHAMLLARARPATPFLLDIVFYHRMSDPYVAKLRREFIAALESARPRFILELDHFGIIGQGSDSTTEFPELTSFIHANYRLAQSGSGYRIYAKVE